MSISDLHPTPNPAVALAERIKPGSGLAAVEAGAAAEADVRDLGKQKLHYGSTGDWLTHTALVDRTFVQPARGSLRTSYEP